jgi:hypothetical protein
VKLRIIRFLLVVTLASLTQSLPSYAGESFPGRCKLIVKGINYIEGPCEITLEKDGSFTVIQFDGSGTLTYLAIVDASNGMAFWNEDSGANHAHSALGFLTRKGACWSNEQAEVCAWR